MININNLFIFFTKNRKKILKNNKYLIKNKKKTYISRIIIYIISLTHLSGLGMTCFFWEGVYCYYAIGILILISSFLINISIYIIICKKYKKYHLIIILIIYAFLFVIDHNDGIVRHGLFNFISFMLITFILFLFTLIFMLLFIFEIIMKYEFINNNFIFYKFFFLIFLMLISIKNIIDLLLLNLNFSKNIIFKKEDAFKILEYINITLYDKIVNKIKVGIYSNSLKNGGVERNTALLINYLAKIKIFELYIFTNTINKSEYKLSDNIKRIIVYNQKNILKRHLLSYKINIFIYQSYDKPIMTMLKGLKSLKVIFYNHSCFLFWIYTKNRFILNKLNGEKSIPTSFLKVLKKLISE